MTTTLEPHTITLGGGPALAVEDDLSERIDRLVAARQRRTSEDAATARRAVQRRILEAGIDEVERTEEA